MVAGLVDANLYCENEQALKVVTGMADWTGNLLKDLTARCENNFTFRMKVNPGVGNILLLTYIGDDKDRKFDVLVDGNKIAYVEWNGGTAGKFYDNEYIIPAGLIGNKTSVTVITRCKPGQNCRQNIWKQNIKGTHF